MLCQECSKREDCTELCDEAEEYTNQDYVPQREEPIGEGIENMAEDFSDVDVVSFIYLTPIEKEIVTLLGRGLSKGDVCEVLKMSNNTLRQHVFRMKQKLPK